MESGGTAACVYSVCVLGYMCVCIALGAQDGKGVAAAAVMFRACVFVHVLFALKAQDGKGVGCSCTHMQSMNVHMCMACCAHGCRVCRVWMTHEGSMCAGLLGHLHEAQT